MNELTRKEVAASLLSEMEATSARVRALIIGMPACDLLGYVYAKYFMKVVSDRIHPKKQGEAVSSNDVINENQFLLEYIHAVLASDLSAEATIFDEASYTELFELGRKLHEQAIFFAMATAAATVSSPVK
jgi:hypothetical protein